MDSSYVSTIKYCFIKSDGVTYPNTDDFYGSGIPISSSFDIQCEVPVDSRFVVPTYNDLLQLMFTYNGLLTYVEDIDTFFRYTKGTWLPTSTRVWVIEDSSVLTAEMGGWDDVAICTNGTIYRKRYNNVWEEWGNITGSGSSGESEYPALRFNEEYDPTKLYLHNNKVVDLVYHEGSTYYCKQNCMGIAPSNDKVYWTYFAKADTNIEEVTN